MSILDSESAVGAGGVRHPPHLCHTTHGTGNCLFPLLVSTQASAMCSSFAFTMNSRKEWNQRTEPECPIESKLISILKWTRGLCLQTNDLPLNGMGTAHSSLWCTDPPPGERVCWVGYGAQRGEAPAYGVWLPRHHSQIPQDVRRELTAECCALTLCACPPPHTHTKINIF